jgi:hypothetical protein
MTTQRIQELAQQFREHAEFRSRALTISSGGGSDSGITIRDMLADATAEFAELVAERLVEMDKL